MSDWDFLWGLEGQELLDAMATGATYEEWAYIEAQEHEDGNIALFIDGENISNKLAKQILEKANYYGTLAVSKVYGLQKAECTKKWTEKAKENDIEDIRLCGAPEKNKVDKKIIKDMKKAILKHRQIDTICLAAHDGGYANVLKELRDLGLKTVIIGTPKMSKKLKDICDKFEEL